MSEERLAVCSILEGDQFAAISCLVDRITHDMNNLLLPIIAYPSLVRRAIAEGNRAQDMVGAIEQAGQSLLYISRQLMAMRPESGGEREQVDLNSIADVVVQGIRGEGVVAANTLTLGCGTAAVRVEGSPDRTRRAVEILVRNALEALPARGGTVHIAVQEASVEAGRFGVVPARSGVFGTVCVADNGEGFDEETGKRIFDPFFTTRRSQSRRGAGLGLSIAYRVAADQGGWLTYRGDPGKGAVFTLYLPRP